MALCSAHINVLSFCSGGGGLDLGIKIAEPRARTVCYIEREAYAAATIVARMEDAALDRAPIWDDLTTFDGRPWRGLVHGISGGYPCQGESNAGQRKGINDPRWLWPHVSRVMRETEAEWGFFENVGAHLSRSFIHVLSELQGMGFRVAAGLFTALEAGGSHERERLFILADTGRSQWRPSAAGRDFADRHDRGREETAGRSGKSGQELAYAARRGRGQVLGGQAEERLLDPGCADMADASGVRCGTAWGHEPRFHIDADLDRQGHPLAHAGRAGLSHAEQRREPGEAARRDSAEQSIEQLRGTLPLAAPGPLSIRWAQILALDPALEPSLCRMAHAMAYRVDRLRLTGNGVFPLAAALAYRTLRTALDAGLECRSADDIVLMGAAE